MAVAFFFLISQLTDQADVGIEIEGKEYAPQLVEFLNENGIVEKQGDWSENEVPIILRLPENWSTKIADAEPVEVELKADWSSQKQQTDIKRVEKGGTSL